ncbi:apoptosis-inducing factor-like protein [Acrasis kona]|uniref:Apoptosis-inducing factor-like protein n=1 Tax=Acrasis kona TaxID=1008807 RepID=A0AAW2ZC03_9EUKA
MNPTASHEHKKNIVIVGGGFGGSYLARKLSKCVPKTHRVVLVEKKTHFSYSYAIPRYSVLQGIEDHLFIPYEQLLEGDDNIVVHSEVECIQEHHVVLKTNQIVHFDYLVIATGARLTLRMWDVASHQIESGRNWLRDIQKSINKSSDIVIVGGGAYGIQTATDIKDFYPQKSVTLVHSRPHLMNRFKSSLHEVVMKSLLDQGIRVILNDRVIIPPGGFSGQDSTTVTTKNGDQINADFVLLCGGQTPLSETLLQLAPDCVDAESKEIKVEPTLQIANCQYNHIFAIGDVADTGAQKLAAYSCNQGDIVIQNILALIDSKESDLKTYIPDSDYIKLTLGLKKYVIYKNDGQDITLKHDGVQNIHLKWIWEFLGADWNKHWSDDYKKVIEHYF